MTPLTFHEKKHAAPEDAPYLELVLFPVHRGQQKLLIFRLALQVLMADKDFRQPIITPTR